MIYRTETYADGAVVTVEEWNTDTSVYTRTEDGQVVESRAFTVEETAAFAARAAADQAAANEAETGTKLVTVDLPAMQAIIAQTNADLRADPAQEIKDIARAVRRLCRQVENIHDGVD